MAVPVTVVYWANIELSRGFDFAFAPGIQPSVCNIYTVPHVDSLPNTGTLTFYTKDTSGAPLQTFEFPDCLLEAPRLSVSADGQLWTLPIKDRRWMWQFGWIDGSYNIPEPDGISFKREKTPQELATLLLEKMDEVGYDVSQLPDDENARPHVEWDSANPASELDTLCQQFGCIVVLNPLTNAVEIWPEGTGASVPPLPSNIPYSGLGFADVYPAQPKNVIMEAANTLWEMTFLTVPVGRDTDGAWKLLDDLSYKPDDGWEAEYSDAGFAGIIEGTYEDNGQLLQISDLADSCVYRCFKLSGLVGYGEGEWAPELLIGDPDLEPQTFKDLKIFTTLTTCEIQVDDPDGDESVSLVPLPAVAFTKRIETLEDIKRDVEVEGKLRVWPYGFQLDTVHGIATFPFGLLLSDDNDAIPAIVRIRCAFMAGKDGVFHRHFVESDTGSTVETPSRLDKHKEIQRTISIGYDNEIDALSTDDPIDNETDCDERLNYWLDAALSEYGLQQGGTATYESLVALSPDGLIQQITWSASTNQGPKTQASAAQRHNRYVASLETQRRDISIPHAQNKLASIDKALRSTVDLERLTVA